MAHVMYATTCGSNPSHFNNTCDLLRCQNTDFLGGIGSITVEAIRWCNACLIWWPVETPFSFVSFFSSPCSFYSPRDLRWYAKKM